MSLTLTATYLKFGDTKQLEGNSCMKQWLACHAIARRLAGLSRD